MAYFDLATINTAIESTLSAAAGIKRAQDLDELTESIGEMNLPLLQVVPNSWSGASRSSTHTNSFTGRGTQTTAIKEKTWVYTVFVYVDTLAKFSRAMTKLVEIGAAITEILDAQADGNLFGAEAIRSFQYQAERGIINYSNMDYHGISITLTIELW